MPDSTTPAKKAPAKKAAAAKKAPARQPASSHADAADQAPAKSSGFRPGQTVEHVSGARYVVLAQGDTHDMGDGTHEHTYVLVPEGQATHPQPASLLRAV